MMEFVWLFVVLLILHGILYSGPFLLFVFMIALGFERNKARRNDRLLVILCVLFVPVTALRIYVYDWNDVRDWFYASKFKRACRRIAPEMLPPEPVKARGVALEVPADISRSADGCSGPCGVVTDPLYYLGKYGGATFDFVEYRGKRYAGTALNYTVEPIRTSQAQYVLRFTQGYADDRYVYAMSVAEAGSNREIAHLDGLRRRWDACPSVEHAGSFFSRAVTPDSPRNGPPAPAPVSATALARREEIPSLALGEVPPALSGTSGAALGCTHVAHAGATERSQPLEFLDAGKTRTVYPAIQGLSHPAQVLDVACQGTESLVLARGWTESAGAAHFLIRYTGFGNVHSVVRVEFEPGGTPEPPRNGGIHSFHARRLRWEGDDVAFTLIALQASSRGLGYVVERAHDYTLTLPPAAPSPH